jgi:hypothetical protein
MPGTQFPSDASQEEQIHSKGDFATVVQPSSAVPLRHTDRRADRGGVSRGEAGFVLEVPAVAALRPVPSAVTHCVDLVTGLVSFEDVGEFGAVREQCRSREVRVESSFAGPHFVTMTVVTAQGYLVPVVLAQRVARLPEPARHQVRRRRSRGAGDPGHPWCRPRRRLHLLRGRRRARLRGLPPGGYLMRVFSPGRIFYGRRDDPPGHRNTLPPGTPSSAAPRRPDVSRPLIHCSK